MNKKKLLFLFAAVALGLLTIIVSCKKDFNKKSNPSGGADKPSYTMSAVAPPTLSNGMLCFTDADHYDAYLAALESQVDAYLDELITFPDGTVSIDTLRDINIYLDI